MIRAEEEGGRWARQRSCRRRRLLGLLLLLVPLGGCVSFAPVRPAEMYEGFSLTGETSVTTPPGEQAAWLQGGYCQRGCDGFLLGGDLGLTYGHRSGHGLGYELSIGTTGIWGPYADAYVQLSRDDHPFGIGARGGRAGFHFYARYDVELPAGDRLLLNPGFFWNPANDRASESRLWSTGELYAGTQGIGFLFEGDRISLTPSVTLVAGRGTTYRFARVRDFSTFFAVVSLSATLHRSRDGGG